MSWLTALGLGTDKNKTEGEGHICGYQAVSDKGEDVGSIDDYVVDNAGKLRYLVVKLGHWFVGKKVLIPVGMAQIEDDRKAVLLLNFTREQVERLPDYDERKGFSEDYERQLMSSYYPNQRPYINEAGNLDYGQYEAFKTPERMQLLEERLQVQKRSEVEGNVTIGKRVETHEEVFEVPLMRERLVIERHPVSETSVGPTDIQPGMQLSDESITIPLYAEEVEVIKRPVVAEEVTIRKERETETQTVRETVSREVLDIEDPDRMARPGWGETENRGVDSTDRGQPAGERNTEEEAISEDHLITRED